MFSMKEKKLYSSAIIPDKLYVQRDADRKLKEVILRMSKPAYISVARQMGKTNLLIQTKRELQNETNRYVYIDITNKFETAQDCFRYIVNQILNSNEELEAFQEAKKQIESLRQTSTNNATEEYQNEIREILKKHKGNLVVFLDEVDDLRKHAFSDDIFGQIRKTYFINETYPVLKRITYVLSGVIDPEKLIKTKENSPFNIAIPIYLEDFNQTEFYELINKSELVLENEIKEYIYDWLQGNPRMSFEILSLIEDEFIAGNEINIAVVNKAINDFYLTNFKNPPIDHIRDLIKHNTDVRKALIKLKNGQIEELTDEIINKFYLFGITASKTKKENLKIKNKVIELSLSNDWLDKIELEKKGYYDFGNEKIKQGLFLEGIQLLKEYLQNEPKGSFSQLAKHDIGKAYYEIGLYELSNQYLVEKPIDKDTSSELYYWQLFYTGANYLKIGQFEKAMSYFEEIINEANIAQVVINAMVNKGELLINSPIKYESQEIENIYLKAIKYISEKSEKISEQEKLLSLIYYRLGEHYLKDKEKSNNAVSILEKGLQYATNENLAIFYLLIDSNYDKDKAKRTELYDNLSKLIIEKQIRFGKSEEAIIPEFNELQLFLILSNLLEFNLKENFNLLIEYSLSVVYDNSLQDYELLYKTSVFAINSNNLKVGKELMHKVINFNDVDAKILKYCYQVLGILEYNAKNISESLKYLSKYVQLFKENENFNEELQGIDFNAFNTLLDYYREKKEYEKSFEIAKIIEKYFDENLNYENKANSIVILFFIMDYYAFIGDKINATDYGKKILSLVDIVKPVLNELSYVDKKGIEHIEKQTKSLLRNFEQVKSIEPIQVEREPGRNEFVKVKYKDGRELVTKYKKVIEDIKKGECRIINN
ncbi:MAG: hypothetical protein CVU10_03505 [Bacteroidetes bacterium HGW-Bacteroidetes-5]|nr:MAG: hypothetical protein CVU10_03505 [Bacteroidetes bacterium HGW-Bacteroidetes-5]